MIQSFADRQSLLWRLGSTSFFVVTQLFLTSRFVAEPFRYLGYNERVATTTEVGFAVAASAVLAVVAPPQWRRASDSAYAFLIATVALPVLWIPVFYGPLQQDQVAMLQLIAVAGFLAMRLTLVGERRSLRVLVVPRQLLWTILVSVVAVVLAFLVFRVGLRFEILGFAEVYDQRDFYSGRVGALGAYLPGWVGSGVLPMVIAFGLWQRHPLMVASGVTGVLVLYSLTGFKSYLIGVVLIFGAYGLAASRRPVPTDWVFWLAAAMWVAALLDRVTDNLIFTSLFVRRAIATSGLNTAFFMDYFGRQPTYELRHSVLSFLGESPYPAPPARWIGLHYYESLDTAANANFLADGLANFGVVGALGAAVLLGLCLRGYDVLSDRLPLPVATAGLMFVLVAVSNTALLTVLLTHGGFVAAAMAWVLAGQEHAKTQTRRNALRSSHQSSP